MKSKRGFVNMDFIFKISIAFLLVVFIAITVVFNIKNKKTNTVIIGKNKNNIINSEIKGDLNIKDAD